MRKVFLLGLSAFAAVILGGAAQAADMPVKAQPMAAPVMYNWTGFYIGGHIGGAWRDRKGHDRFDADHDCFWGVWAVGVFASTTTMGTGAMTATSSPAARSASITRSASGCGVSRAKYPRSLMIITTTPAASSPGAQCAIACSGAATAVTGSRA